MKKKYLYLLYDGTLYTTEEEITESDRQHVTEGNVIIIDLEGQDNHLLVLCQDNGKDWLPIKDLSEFPNE
jgi:hypothetical protein